MRYCAISVRAVHCARWLYAALFGSKVILLCRSALIKMTIDLLSIDRTTRQLYETSDNFSSPLIRDQLHFSSSAISFIFGRNSMDDCYSLIVIEIEIYSVVTGAHKKWSQLRFFTAVELFVDWMLRDEYRHSSKRLTYSFDFRCSSNVFFAWISFGRRWRKEKKTNLTTNH